MLVFDSKLIIDNSTVLRLVPDTSYRINEVEIEKSVNSISNTAVIKLAHSEMVIKDTIKVGSKIEVKLGYDGHGLKTEFAGYVTKIKPETPFTLFCEDEAWNLKRRGFSKSWQDTNLKQVIKDIFETSTLDTVHDIEIKTLTFKETTKYKALERLKEEYGLMMYFRNDGTLFAGIPFSDEFYIDKEAVYTLTPPRDLHTNFNINVIDFDLNYITKDRVKYKVKAVSFLDDGTKLISEFGDDDGEYRTLHFTNIKDEMAL